MKVGIIGTRGIPNHYGGFEQFAEYLSLGLINRGHSVSVYNSHMHPYQESEWRGVRIIHKYDPENRLGTFGQFVYDLLCILDSRKRKFDVILQLGYTSNSVWGNLLPNKSIIVTNMDGLEWKRSKYSKQVRQFLRWAEKRGVQTSDFLVADSKGIQDHLERTYGVSSEFIPYGATVFSNPQEMTLEKFGIRKYEYDMLIARMEPENNIEMILTGFSKSNVNREFVVIGNYTNTAFGKDIFRKFSSDKRIRFLGPVYDIEALNNIRHFSNIYFHGHSVGGTNPSLLEAMACGCFISAHNNVFNRAILEYDAIYFESEEEIFEQVEQNIKLTFVNQIGNNVLKIEGRYSWEVVIDQYEKFLLSVKE